jgi:hypothetical protein
VYVLRCLLGEPKWYQDLGRWTAEAERDWQARRAAAEQELGDALEEYLGISRLWAAQYHLWLLAPDYILQAVPGGVELIRGKTIRTIVPKEWRDEG